VAAVAALAVQSASAQIINTLRGFDDEEYGWSGGVLGSMALAEGNTQYFEFEVDAKVQYQSERHRWRAIASSTRRTALGAEVAESRVAHLRHNYRFLPRVSSIVFLQGQYNPFVRVETRVLVGGGARVEVVQGIRWNSAVGLTLMHEIEELTYQKGEYTTRNRFSFFLTVYRAEKKGVNIDIWGFYQPVIDDLANARASGAASIRVNVVGGLYFLAGYVVSHDSNPPESVKKLDQTLRSGLGWDF
jgi:hypothetical protein